MSAEQKGGQVQAISAKAIAEGRHPIYDLDKIVPIEAELEERIRLFEEVVLKGQTGAIQASVAAMLAREYGTDVIGHYQESGRITGIG